MNSRTTIQNELKDLSSALPLLNEKPVFTVPEGYFENFAASVLDRIYSQSPMNTAEELTDLSPLLAGISKRMPYSVPENYFSSLTSGLSALSTEDELPEVLRTHNKQQPFTIPTGYFEGLPAQVVARVKPKAKVVSFGNFKRFAAAAAITGLIAIGSLLYFKSNNTSVALDPSKQSEEWVAKKLQHVSNQDLEKFLQATDVTPSREIAHNGKRQEVRQLLKDVSTNELDAFLDDVTIPETEDFSLYN